MAVFQFGVQNLYNDISEGREAVEEVIYMEIRKDNDEIWWRYWWNADQEYRVYLIITKKQIITVMQNHLSLLLLVSNEMLYHDWDIFIW